MDDIDLEPGLFRGRSPARSARARIPARSGRYVRAVQVKPGERYFDLAADATLRAALIRQGGGLEPRPHAPVTVTAGDLRKKQYKRPQKSLIIIVVDASDSMGQGTHLRMKAAKGAALAVLAKAYPGRHVVGMVTFRDKFARVVLQPTTSVSRARRQLQAMATGGATPMADGLMKSWQVIKTQRRKDPGIRPLMVLISDGDANVAYDTRRNSLRVMEELLQIARGLARDRVASIVIDTGPLSVRDRRMQSLARTLDGEYHHITGLQAGHVVKWLNGRMVEWSNGQIVK